MVTNGDRKTNNFGKLVRQKVGKHEKNATGTHLTNDSVELMSKSWEASRCARTGRTHDGAVSWARHSG